jgi:hypothetical protein
MNKTSPLTSGCDVEIDYTELDRIIEEDFNNDKEYLIMMLQAIQKHFNYLTHTILSF